MRTAAQSLAEIARLLEAALADDVSPLHRKMLLIQAHTHAVIQGAAQRKAEARAVFAAHSHLEHGTMQ